MHRMSQKFHYYATSLVLRESDSIGVPSRIFILGVKENMDRMKI